MKKLVDSKLRIDAYKYLGITAALQIPIYFQKFPESVGGALVKNNEIFIDEELDYQGKLLILSHELLHFLLNHIKRGAGKIPELWGVAIDHVVNTILTDTVRLTTRYEIQERRLVQFNPGVPEGPAELIYRSLLKRLQRAKEEGSPHFSFGGITFSMEGIPQGVNLTDHSYQSGLDIGSGNLSEFERNLKSKGVGSLDLRREIEQGFKHQIDWTRLLVGRILSFVGKKISSPTYTRIPYYQLGTPFQVRLPSVYKKDFSLVTAFDTSGSISKTELTKFCAEFQAILRLVSESWVYIIDDSIKSVLHNPDFTTLVSQLQGGGGTSFIPVFEDIQNRGLRPQLLVYFTDTFGDFPKTAPPYPVIWIVVRDWQTSSISVPFGTVYYVD